MLKTEQRNQSGDRFSSILQLAVVVLFAMTASVGGAAEKSYPQRPINMIVGFAPGGASDLGSKIISDEVSKVIGQPLLSVYKPGATGALAASFVKKSTPDGYTMLVVTSSIFIPPELRKVDYSIDDFIITGITAKVPYFMAVRAQSPWKNLKDFAAEAKKSPGKLTFGTTGTAVGGYWVYQLFAKYAGIELTFVPFKSCGEVMTALLGGHIDAYSCVGVGAISETTLVRPLAVAEDKRLEGYANVPTFSEQGYPVVFRGINGLAFPKGTPKDAVTKMADAQRIVMEKHGREIGEKLRSVDMWPAYFGPQESLREFRTSYETIDMLTKEAAFRSVSPGKK